MVHRRTKKFIIFSTSRQEQAADGGGWCCASGSANLKTSLINNFEIGLAMVLTKEMFDSYIDSNRISINTEKYKKILYELGTEEDEDYSLTDQDIYEQLRKMIKDEKN